MTRACLCLTGGRDSTTWRRWAARTGTVATAPTVIRYSLPRGGGGLHSQGLWVRSANRHQVVRLAEEKESNRREDKGRRCCLVYGIDSILCRTKDLAPR